MADATQIKLENNMERIAGSILSGNVLNPTNNLKSPCSICNKNCLDNQASIECSKCKKYCHIKCDGTTKEHYRYYQETQDDPEVKWYCLWCTMRYHHKHIAFTLSNTNEIENVNNSDNMEFCNFLPSLEVIHETSNYSKYSLPDDDFLPKHLTSKYHSVYDFQKLKIEKDFNIFHANVNGLESKYENLHNFLGGSKSAMDVIAITETSEHNEHSFTSNVDMEGYIHCLVLLLSQEREVQHYM